jgi:hypothetical protein
VITLIISGEALHYNLQGFLFYSLQVVEKVVFPRLVKNIRMHGARNPEE